MLQFIAQDAEENLIANDARIVNSEIISPCFIGQGVSVVNSIIGPNVSLGLIHTWKVVKSKIV